MSIYYNQSCAPIPAPVCGACPTIELGRVRSLWIQNQAFTFVDITDPTEWLTAISNGDVVTFPFTNGSVDVASVTSEGYGNTPTTTDSHTYTITAHDPSLGNIPLWNALQNNNFWLVGYKTETLGWLSSVPATFDVSVPVATDVTKHIDVMLKITFVQTSTIVPVAVPAIIFEECLVEA